MRININEENSGLNVIAVLSDMKTGKIKEVHETHNIITNAGDLYYAERGAEETVTNIFADCELGTGSVAAAKTDDWSDLTLITSSEKAVSATYPMTDDQDAANTGKAVDSVTWKFEWVGADFNDAAIYEGVIVVTGASGTDPVLTRFVFAASFGKTADDTLTIYINHNFLGI